MLHLHVHNVLSLYSILMPPQLSRWHFTKTSWPNQFHVVLSRNLPTQDQPCNHTARQAQATSPHDLFTFDSRGQLLSTRAAWRSHYSFWQLNSFAIAWNFSTTTFGKSEDTHTLSGCACVKTHHALRLRHRESLFKGKISKVGTWHMTAFLPWTLMCENVYVPWLRGNHATHVWVLKQEHPCQEIKPI